MFVIWAGGLEGRNGTGTNLQAILNVIQAELVRHAKAVHAIEAGEQLRHHRRGLHNQFADTHGEKIGLVIKSRPARVVVRCGWEGAITACDGCGRSIYAYE